MDERALLGYFYSLDRKGDLNRFLHEKTFLGRDEVADDFQLDYDHNMMPFTDFKVPEPDS